MAQQLAETSLALATTLEAPFWGARSTFMCGIALTRQGRTDRGSGADAQRVGGHTDERVYDSIGAISWRAVQKRCCMPDKPDAAHTVLAEALAFIHTSGERWWEAECHRLWGECFLAQKGPKHEAGEAVARLQHALDIARQQQARSLELRAAISLSRLASSREGARKPGKYWRRSMAASPRALIPPTSGRPKHCWKRWRDNPAALYPAVGLAWWNPWRKRRVPTTPCPGACRLPSSPPVARARQSSESASGWIKLRLYTTAWLIRWRGPRHPVGAAQQPCARGQAHPLRPTEPHNSSVRRQWQSLCRQRPTPYPMVLERSTPRPCQNALCQVHVPGLPASPTMRTQGDHAFTHGHDATMAGAHIPWHHPCIYRGSNKENNTMKRRRTLRRMPGVMALVGLATCALPLLADARVRAAVDIGLPVPVVLAPAPAVVTSTGYYGSYWYPYRSWRHHHHDHYDGYRHGHRHGYQRPDVHQHRYDRHRHGYRGPHGHHHRWHRW